MRLRMILLKGCVAFVCVSLALVCAAQRRPCTESQQREAMSIQPKDWNGFYAAFRSLGQCDDGAPAENFSDITVRLLARDWKDITDLVKLAASDRAFQRFVLKHVDATTDPDDLKAVVSNARRRCPAAAIQLCRALASQARSALRESETQ